MVDIRESEKSCPQSPSCSMQGAFWGPLLRDKAKVWKRKNIIVVIGNGGFRGNTKYAFLSLWRFLNKKNRMTELYYVGNDQEVSFLQSVGLPALSREHEWQQTALKLLKARIALYGDHDFVTEDRWFWQACLEGAVKIQLWHGVPVKRGGAEYLSRTEDYYFFTGLLYDSCGYHLAISESKISKSIYRACFPQAQVLAFGSVRNDLLVCPKQFDSRLWRLGLQEQIFRYLEGEKQKGKKIVLCCPTYQESNDIFDAFIQAWIPALSQLAALPGVCVALKMHPNDEKEAPSLIKKVLCFCRSAGVVYIPCSEDIHPYYTLADCLVTDYSSVWLDYILMRRPLVFYRAYDNLYKSFRDLITYPSLDINEVGPLCVHHREVVERVKAELEQPSRLENIERWAVMFHRNARDGMAGRRLWNLIRWIFDKKFSPDHIVRTEGEEYYDRD